MGFRESFGPFFGKGVGQVSGARKFDLNQKHTTIELQKAAKNLKRSDRLEFFGAIKEGGRWGKTSSNRQLDELMKKSPALNRVKRERIKSQALKPIISEVDQEKIRRNVRLTTFDRLREEAKRPVVEKVDTGLVDREPVAHEQPKLD